MSTCEECSEIGTTGDTPEGMESTKDPRVPIVSGADDGATCGICLEPAGSAGWAEDGSGEGGGWLAGCGRKVRMSLNSRRLPACNHRHCSPCWAQWVKTKEEEARARGRTEATAVRCPLCGIESPKGTMGSWMEKVRPAWESVYVAALHPLCVATLHPRVLFSKSRCLRHLLKSM